MSPFDSAGERNRSQRSGSASALGGIGRSDPEQRHSREAGTTGFTLYVEGPRDWDLLRIWARRLSPALARSLDPGAVILGGRQPARAVEHFRSLGGAAAGGRGLVVLDRDHHTESRRIMPAEPGLEFFTWGRRHIESYVLVPDAIRRFLARGSGASRANRLIDDHIPQPDDENAHSSINAKHLLGSKGPLARELGQALSPGAIARCMRAEEFHPDILYLCDRIRSGLGLVEPVCEVVRRPVSS